MATRPFSVPSSSPINLASQVTGQLPVANGGTGASTVAGARTNLGAVGIYTALIGNGSSTSIAVSQATHGLASTGAIMAMAFNAALGTLVVCDITVSSGNGTVTFDFSTAPTTNSIRVVIMG